MKKVWISVLLLGFFISFSGCGREVPQVPVYQYEVYQIHEPLQDGHYKMVAQGRNGDFDVMVTVKAGQLDRVVVGDNQETKDIGAPALKQLSQKIMAKKTPNVDGITGATISSFALKDAVSRALEEASKK